MNPILQSFQKVEAAFSSLWKKVASKVKIAYDRISQLAIKHLFRGNSSQATNPLNDRKIEETGINQLPPEVQVHLANQLGAKDLANLSQVSSTWNLASQDALTLFKIQADYPAPMIEALGGIAAFKDIPTLNLGQNIEDSRITPEAMTAPVMKGKDNLGRPFIALRFQYQSENGIKLYARLLHQETADDKKIWRIQGDTYPLFGDFIIDEFNYNRLNRLIKHEPLGQPCLAFEAGEPLDPTNPDGPLKMIRNWQEDKTTLANGQSAFKLV